MYIHRQTSQTTFDTETGYLIRTGDEKPLAPEVIDLKVTEQCKSTLCNEFCYMCSDPNGRHADVDWIIKQLSTFQEPPFEIALGGGDPSLWPGILDFISWGRTNNIVINAAVGPAANLEIVEKITGPNGLSALGISLVEEESFLNVVNAAKNKNSKIFAHCILRNDKIDYWIERRDWILSQVECIIFLLFKPHGRGVGKDLLPSFEQVEKILEHYKDSNIGFDSCCYPVLKEHVPNSIISNCDGGYYSLFIDGIQKTASRCSFLDKEFDLNNMTLNQAWEKIGIVDNCKYSISRRYI